MRCNNQEGKIWIKEYIKTTASGEKTAAIRISDNGPGIPEKFRDKIFDPYPERRRHRAWPKHSGSHYSAPRRKTFAPSG